ncbi:MAG: glycoside hydrolase family 3 N-terminal domain-containing protein [Maritimibacter sp.]
MSDHGAFLTGIAGPRLTRDEQSFLRDAAPWGFMLYQRNVEDPEQLAWLTAELRDAVGWEAPIFIDPENGQGERLGPPHWRDWLPPLEQVQLNPRQAVRSMYLRYRLIADELQAMGIDGNCAPVVDLAHADTHPDQKNRCYGDDVVRVVDIAGAVAEALVDGGVIPLAKHMPGQGRAMVDPHEELPRISTREKALRVSDFLAFQAVSGLPIAMATHALFEDIDPENPTPFSPDVIARIREEIGFAGMLMTDDISLPALSGPLETRVQTALASGCDMILHGSGDLGEMQAVATAAGSMSVPAKMRAEDVLSWRRPPEPVDIQALEAEFQSLMTGQV